MLHNTKGYDFKLNGARLGAAGHHLDDRSRGVALVRLLRAGERDTAVMLGLLPDGDEPGWAPGVLIERRLRRLGVAR